MLSGLGLFVDENTDSTIMSTHPKTVSLAIRLEMERGSALMYGNTSPRLFDDYNAHKLLLQSKKHSSLK